MHGVHVMLIDCTQLVTNLIVIWTDNCVSMYMYTVYMHVRKHDKCACDGLVQVQCMESISSWAYRLLKEKRACNCHTVLYTWQNSNQTVVCI